MPHSACVFAIAGLHRHPPRLAVAAVVQEIEHRLYPGGCYVRYSRTELPRFERAAVGRHAAVDAHTRGIAYRIVSG